MRWLLASALGGGLVLAPATAQAHPLGNFTVNTAAELVLRPTEVAVDYVVDMAEIPAFQERERVDGDRDGRVTAVESATYRGGACAEVARGLSLAIDGHAADLTVRSSTLAFPLGEAGLRTLRLSCLLAAPIGGASTHHVRFADANFADRIGWREVTAVGDGATPVRSDVPTESPSGRLRSYPTGVAPLHVTSAAVSFRPGGPFLVRDAPDGAPSGGGLLADLVSRPDLGAGTIVALVLVAIAVGALHALGPGHGKTLIGASLVSSGATFRHAISVGLAVSVMHTASVLALGLVVVTAEHLASPERVYPWLGLASGLVALALGAWLLVSRVHALAEERRHGHRHPATPLSRGGLVALAFSGGILPSPSALVVLLGSISMGRTALGLMLIAAFSVGLAGSLVAVGAIAVRVRHLANRRFPERMMRFTPVMSAGCIAAIGLVLTIRGASGV